MERLKTRETSQWLQGSQETTEQYRQNVDLYGYAQLSCYSGIMAKEKHFRSETK